MIFKNILRIFILISFCCVLSNCAKDDLNANSGVLKWKRNLPTFQQIRPIVYEDVIYTGGNEYYYAFNTSDGSEIWRFPIDTYSFTSPTLLIGESEEIIYPSINPSINEKYYT